MKFLKKLIILSSLIIVTGCASAPPTILPQENKVIVSAEVMKDCGFLVDNLQKGSSFEDTLIAHAENAKTFAACKELNNSKKEIIQRFLLNERQKQITSPSKNEVRRIGIFG